MQSARRRRLDNAINAGSMADIAFLLLIFFLVTTTIMEDSGIYVRLPAWLPDPPKKELADRNVFIVKVNAADQLLVEGEIVSIDELRALAREFILNPLGRPDLPPSPKNAIISLQNDRGTSYATYLAVYNELKAAYNELWEAAAQQNYGLPYQDLPYTYQQAIRQEIPLVISEAEPTEHGEEK